MRKLTLILVFLFCFGCNRSELGSNYYLLTDYEANDIGYPYGSILYKSKSENNFTNTIIFSDIKNCIVDKNKILVLQEPNINLFRKRINDDLEFWNDFYLQKKNDSMVVLGYGEISLRKINLLLNEKPVDIVTNELLSKEEFTNKIFINKFNYFIIDKEDDKVIGPLEENDFKKKATELKVKKSVIRKLISLDD